LSGKRSPDKASQIKFSQIRCGLWVTRKGAVLLLTAASYSGDADFAAPASLSMPICPSHPINLPVDFRGNPQFTLMIPSKTDIHFLMVKHLPKRGVFSVYIYSELFDHRLLPLLHLVQIKIKDPAVDNISEHILPLELGYTLTPILKTSGNGISILMGILCDRVGEVIRSIICR